jgi:hypothetical protein
MATTPQPQPQEDKPSLFRKILATGLLGLAGGLAAKNESQAFGAGLEAVNQNFDRNQNRMLLLQNNQRAQRQLELNEQNTANDTLRAQAQAKLQEAQAAQAMVEKMRIEKLMSQMDEEQRLRISDTFSKTTKAFLDSGLPVRAEIEDTLEARTQFLQQMKEEGKNPTDFIFAPDPNAGKIFVLERDNSKVLNKQAAESLSHDIGIKIPAGIPVTTADTYIAHKLDTDARLKVAQMQRNTALEVAKMTKGAFGADNPADMMLVDGYANAVTTGQLTLPQVPAYPKGLRNAVASRIFRSGFAMVSNDTRDKLASLNTAEAAVDQFEKTLHEYLKSKTPANMIRLNAQRSAFARMVGRGSGEKGVFTDPDKVDFQRILGPGLVFTTADPDLAQKQVEDIRDFLSNIKMRTLQGSVKAYKLSDLQQPEKPEVTGEVEEFDADGNPIASK